MPPKRQYKPNYSRYKNKKPIYRKPVYRKPTMRPVVNLVKLIKAVNLKQAETKYKTITNTVNNLFHDTLTDFQIWDSSGSANIFPAQGTTDADRLGDRS